MYQVQAIQVTPLDQPRHLSYGTTGTHNTEERGEMQALKKRQINYVSYFTATSDYIDINGIVSCDLIRFQFRQLR